MRLFKISAVLLLLCLFITACVTATQSGLESTVTVPVPTMPTTPPIVIATQPPTQQPTPSSTPEGAWIRLVPDSGFPGTVVHINGYLPGGLPQTDLASQDYTTYASACWNGCQTGLQEDGLEVKWSQTGPGIFSLEFTVPSIPWLASDGFHGLEAGNYSIDMINLDPSKIGCNSHEGCSVTPVASATFNLTQSAVYPPCQEEYCGSLVASPTQAAPGERVQVRGWAPLVQFVGEPFGYNLVLETKDNTSPENVMNLAVQQNEAVQQARDGNLTASFQVPQYGNDGAALRPGSYILALMAPLTSEKNPFSILVAPTPFEITAAPTWSNLLSAVPLWVQTSADLTTSSLATDPLDPARLAYCATGEIQLSQDSGQTWTNVAVNTTSLPMPSDRLAIGEDKPTCVSVTLDSSHPHSLYAVFSLVDKEYGAPPIYFEGYFTYDLGKTWQLVPVPSIETSQQVISDNFGGFWTDGKTVQALYYEKAINQNQLFPLLAKQTVDGGMTWSEAPLACPATGPCVRWGAAPGMIGGMGADLPQSVLASADEGKTWSDTGQSIELRMTGPHELVALSASELLLLSGQDRFPLRYSNDGGKTWLVISLPTLPGIQSSGYAGYPGLQIMPDGSLLAMRPDTGQWMRLSPSAQDWCPIGLTSANLSPALLLFSGNRVWWISVTTMLPQSAPQSELVCQK
jgi:hypothetical protein